MSPEFYMKRALALAKRAWGKTAPNPMVGAVIVRDGIIVGEGFHPKAGFPHAEIYALKSAGEATRGADLYVTLEPCSSAGRTPPCTDAILRAGIRQVFIGCLDPNPLHAGRGITLLESGGIVCYSGICETAARELNEHFFHWITTGLPLVTLKMAMTLDGKIATVNGESQWVTGETARRRVQKLRQNAGAILVGAETVRRDHPSLRVRTPQNWMKQPLRLVASSSLSQAELIELMPEEPSPILVDCSSYDATLNLLQSLGKQQIVSLLVEGGGTLASSLLKQGVIQKIEFHIAPKILGGKDSRSVVGGLNPLSLCEALPLSNLKTFRLGSDFAVTASLAEECL